VTFAHLVRFDGNATDVHSKMDQGAIGGAEAVD
jgi:hypothetical protein